MRRGNPDCPECTYDSLCLDCQGEIEEARYQQHIARLRDQGLVPCDLCGHNGTTLDQPLCQKCIEMDAEAERMAETEVADSDWSVAL